MNDDGFLFEYDLPLSGAERSQVYQLRRMVPPEDRHWWPKLGRLWVSVEHAALIRSVMLGDEQMDAETAALLGPAARQLELFGARA